MLNFLSNLLHFKIFLMLSIFKNPNIEILRVGSESSTQSGWGVGKGDHPCPGGIHSMLGPHSDFTCFAFRWSGFELYLIE